MKAGKTCYVILKLFLVLILILIAAVVFLAYYPETFFVVSGEITDAVLKEQVGPGYDGETVNLVLLGFDSSGTSNEKEEIYRPDTIMVAAINLREAEVNLVNIPRDSYVQIYGTDIQDKINHSYMYGYYRPAEGEDPHKSALRTTLLTIRDFLGGLPLHGFISIDMAGAADVVESIGGIYYDVDFDVRSDYGHGKLQVEEGKQLLDEKKFMDFVRDRAKHHGGDLGRAKRHQKVMIALLDQLKGLEGVIKIPRLYSAVVKNVETELKPPQMFLLGLLGMRVNPSEIETFVFGGHEQLAEKNEREIWYFVIDEQERVEIIESVFGVTVEKRPGVTPPEPVDPESEEESEPDSGDSPDTDSGPAQELEDANSSQEE